MNDQTTNQTPNVAAEVTASLVADYLTPAQAAAALGVSGSTFKRIIGTGQVPFRTVGKRRKYQRAELLAYVEASRRFESPPTTNLAQPDPKAKPSALPIASRSPLAIPPVRPGRKSLNPFADRLRLQAEGGNP